MFDLNWTLPVTAGIFLLTLLALNRLFFQPLFQVLEERKAQTVDLNLKTDELLARYQELYERYSAEIRRRREEGYKLGEVARNAAVEERRERIARARKEAEESLEKARLQLRQELEAAKKELEGMAEELAASVAEKVLERT